MIRDARAEDLSKIRGIEAAAGEAFRLIGMAAIADDPPAALERPVLQAPGLPGGG